MGIGILLQSNFSENVQLNGNLTHVGSLEDIHNNSEIADNILFIEIISNANSTNKWGYETSEQRDVLFGKKYLPKLSSNELGMNKTFEGELFYQYIEAERFGSRDNLKLAEHAIHPFWLGTKGEHTIEVLNNIRTRQNHKLSLKHADPRKHPNMSQNIAFDNIEAWMGEISPGYKIELKKEVKANISFNSIISTTGHETKPINIGFGYSYALSIVTALLLASQGDLIIIENPEAHIHPRGQSYLGRLIALTAQAGVQVIIETHSDHLLNGIRVITRIKQDFEPSLVTLYYISQYNGQSSAEKITITKNGKLSNWPNGFFDQQAQDMFTIMTGKTELPKEKVGK